MKIISPIAIDMGAKNTGVYYAKYKQGSGFDGINKKGEVLIYDNDEYTTLLRDRTANRHARRGYQRKKLAKRLLVLVLENYFDFPAKQHAQAIGFLLNRRGFTFLDEEYSREHLANLPDEAWEELSKEIQGILGSRENITKKIDELSSNEPKKIGEIFKAIQECEGYKRHKELKRASVYYTHVNKIAKSCERRIRGESITESRKERDKLSKVSKWIVERLLKDNVESLRETISEAYNVDLSKHLNNFNVQRTKQLREQLPNIAQKEKENKEKLKQSIWGFDIEKFKDNDTNKNGLETGDIKAHLHHFCYAIYKINNELTSGGRHRAKFFNEIREDLNSFENHPHKYLKNFARAIKGNAKLGISEMGNLICHISNFELKPLRAYFNDKTPIEKNKNDFISHAIKNGGDKFCNRKLSRIAATWFLRNWTVNEEKDGLEKVKSYKNLKEQWENHQNKDDIVAFWLKTEPDFTIPPYQSMTNRKPPKCQSLLLNGGYLTEHYPQWKTWLEQLQPNQDYKQKLQNLKSRKGAREGCDGRLISDELIQVRQLQLILDAAKKTDDFQLNEIWSIHHKLEQLRQSDGNVDEWKNKLSKALQDSKLPDELKNDLGFDKRGRFAHFLNKYYKTRRQARAGRYFLHQVSKNNWMDQDKLLAVCTHRPRQKKHQALIDLAAILGASFDEVKKIMGETPEQAEEWFKNNIKGFKGTCEKSAQVQKKYRGSLGIKIGLARKEAEEKGRKKIKEERKDLYNMDEKCKKLAAELAKKIWAVSLEGKQGEDKAEKFSSVFSFAQINNVVFRDRSGFSNTCPVCSADNGFRMQMENGLAKASRLPALSIRLIDGAVMRICDAVSRHVANTCWNSIKGDLEEGRDVGIPLIFEQNRFEFEPNLAKLKAGKTKNETDDREKQYNEKGSRIKRGAKGICAYRGIPLGDDGEMDHIIPQASRYGTLNDEANLIYVSGFGNQDKDKQTKFLGNLSPKYKASIFPGKNDAEIKEFIYCRLQGENARVGEIKGSGHFDFGKYLNFINLTNEQQIAFRHALFLDDSDPLKKEVISALQNRNRAVVNGTQRYMAQCIADKLYKIAQKEGREKQIEFDYFEYPTTAHDSKSIFNLRKFYEGKGAKLSDGTLLTDVAKKPNEEQKLHSHLIDAQMAFLLAADDHKNEGSMGLSFGKHDTVGQVSVDTKTGEFNATKFFDLTRIDPDDLVEVKLKPKSSNKKIIDIEKRNSRKKQNLPQIFNRYAFKQKAIGERYKPIAEFEGKLYCGYPQKLKGGKYDCKKYCTEIKGEIQRFKQIIEEGKYYELTTNSEQIKIWTINKVDKRYKQIDKDSHKYFSEVSKRYTNQEKTEIAQIKLITSECKYYVARVELINAPKVLENANTEKYPFLENWIALDNAWKKIAGSGYQKEKGQYKIDGMEQKWSDFCRFFELYGFKTTKLLEEWNNFYEQESSVSKKGTSNRHAKVRKKFTMIAVGTPPGTIFRINRKGQDIYQAVPLDNTIVAKDRSNFLVKHSKNLTLVSNSADDDLSKSINTTEELEVEDRKIEAGLFFRQDFLKTIDASNIEVHLNRTGVDIKNFPLEKFKRYCRYNENEKSTGNIKDEISKESPTAIEILTRSKSKNSEARLYADKSKIDSSIHLTTRDGKIKGIHIDDKTIDFSLPFKSGAIKRFLSSIEGNE